MPSGRSVSSRPPRSRERVHLLADDVRGVAGGAREERRLLERRRDDLAEAGALEDAHGGLDDELPQRDARRQPVDRRDGGAHGLAHRRSSSRKGFGRALVAERRGLAVPGQNRSFRWVLVEQGCDARLQGRPIPLTQIGAPDRAAEEHVAGVERAVDRERKAAWGVAWNRSHVDRVGPELEPLTPFE